MNPQSNWKTGIGNCGESDMWLREQRVAVEGERCMSILLQLPYSNIESTGVRSSSGSSTGGRDTRLCWRGCCADDMFGWLWD
jgi:hypothetical protein